MQQEPTQRHNPIVIEGVANIPHKFFVYTVPKPNDEQPDLRTFGRPDNLQHLLAVLLGPNGSDTYFLFTSISPHDAKSCQVEGKFVHKDHHGQDKITGLLRDKGIPHCTGLVSKVVEESKDTKASWCLEINGVNYTVSTVLGIVCERTELPKKTLFSLLPKYFLEIPVTKQDSNSTDSPPVGKVAGKKKGKRLRATTIEAWKKYSKQDLMELRKGGFTAKQKDGLRDYLVQLQQIVDGAPLPKRQKIGALPEGPPATAVSTEPKENENSELPGRILRSQTEKQWALEGLAPITQQLVHFSGGPQILQFVRDRMSVEPENQFILVLLFLSLIEKMNGTLSAMMKEFSLNSCEVKVIRQFVRSVGLSFLQTSDFPAIWHRFQTFEVPLPVAKESVPFVTDCPEQTVFPRGADVEKIFQNLGLKTIELTLEDVLALFCLLGKPSRGVPFGEALIIWVDTAREDKNQGFLGAVFSTICQHEDITKFLSGKGTQRNADVDPTKVKVIVQLHALEGTWQSSTELYYICYPNDDAAKIKVIFREDVNHEELLNVAREERAKRVKK